MSNSKRRNVLVVGKSGSGKSTLANKFCGSNTFKVGDGPASETNALAATDFILRDGEVYYSIRIIDTVGLFDSRPNGKSNEEIVKEIKEYFSLKAPEGINLILFTFKAGRMSPEEKDTFNFLFKHFSEHLQPISALLITHGDSLTTVAGSKARQDDHIQKFRDDPVTKQVVEYMGKGVHFMQFPETTDDDEMYEIYKKRCEASTMALRMLVFDCERVTSWARDVCKTGSARTDPRNNKSQVRMCYTVEDEAVHLYI